MVDFNEPFVGAICPKRSLDLDKIIAAARRDPAADTKSLVSTNADYAGALAGAAKGEDTVFGVRSGFARAEYVGMAVTLLQRVVFETMVEKRVVAMRPGKDVLSPVPYYGFFHKLRAADGAFWSEDASFCRRWTKDCGGEIWACVDQEIFHHGTYSYRGTYLDRLKTGLR